MQPHRPHPILLLEDEPDDASFVGRALQNGASSSSSGVSSRRSSPDAATASTAIR